jgi:hypothetical protein
MEARGTFGPMRAPMNIPRALSSNRNRMMRPDEQVMRPGSRCSRGVSSLPISARSVERVAGKTGDHP